MAKANADQSLDKQKFWPKPDYAKMIKDGTAREVVFIQYSIRQHLSKFKLDRRGLSQLRSAHPELNDSQAREYAEKLYRQTSLKLKTMTEQLKKPEDLKKMQPKLYELLGISFDGKYFEVAAEKDFFVASALVNDVWRMNKPKHIEKYMNESKAFAKAVISQENKRPLTRTEKKDMVLRMDIGFQREGPQIMQDGEDISEQMLMDTFRFDLEFGTGMTGLLRQSNLDCAFQSLADMAAALKIPPEEMGLHRESAGNLTLAFASRGRRGRAAHYESRNHLINLTGENGAGSLAHEFGHALDRFMAENMLGDLRIFASDVYAHPRVRSQYPVLHELMSVMLTKTDGSSSEYLKASRKADQNLHPGKIYFAAPVEMFARAFACFVQDKLKDMGISNSYLTGHTGGRADPAGAERKQINLLMEDLMRDLKERGLLHEQQLDYAKFFSQIHGIEEPAAVPEPKPDLSAQWKSEKPDPQAGKYPEYEQITLFDRGKEDEPEI